MIEPGQPGEAPAVTAPHVPWWVTALDLSTAAAVLLALRAALGFGFRLWLGSSIAVSFRSWPRLVGWAIALLIVRHLAWRTIPLHRRIGDVLRRLARIESLAAAWGPFVASRVTVVLIGYLAVVTFGFPDPPAWRAFDNELLNLPARWDSGWYFTILDSGYSPDRNPNRESPIAFFPGFPLVVRAMMLLLRVDKWVAAFLVVTGAFLWGLSYLYRLAREYLPADQARAVLMFLAFYPFAVCYSALYTESLFLLSTVAGVYHFRRREFLKAAPFALLAGLLRPNGFMLAVPLGLFTLFDFARARGWFRHSDAEGAFSWRLPFRQTAVTILPVLGVIGYSVYIYTLVGDPFAWAKAQQAWGRSSGELLALIDVRWRYIETLGFYAYSKEYPVEIFEGLAALFALLAVWPISRRFGLPYGIFVLICVVPPLWSLGPVSLGRYTAPLFPIFLWLGSAVPDGHRPYWYAAFASGQALVAALFFTWRPPY